MLSESTELRKNPAKLGRVAALCSLLQHNTVHIALKYFLAAKTRLDLPSDLLPGTLTLTALRSALKRACFALVLLAPLTASLARELQTPDAAPEAATGKTAQTLVRAQRFMVVSANALATQAGQDILREGGSAVDAAIAIQVVLGLVEPQSSGIGGGAFLLHYDAVGQRVRSYDGRETAPGSVSADLFMRQGKVMPFSEAINSGRAVGSPGVLRMLELAHRRHGKLPWSRLFAPAITLAEQGFAVSPRLHAQIAGNRALFAQEAARDYFYPNGQPAAVGHVLKNPAYAAVLKRIATEGVNAFYEGEIAADIVAAVRAHPVPGELTLADLSGYRAKERTAVCGKHARYQVCSMGPPSSGGIAVLQMLGMLEQHQLDQMQPGSVEAVHYFAEAGRLAFADRERYIADPDFITVPVDALLDPRYLQWRGAQIDSRMSMGTALPGDPLQMLAKRGKDQAADLPSTTHLVVVDAEGHGVSMTSTIESEFGSKIFVRGFLLNNQLTDFSLQPNDNEGRPVANRVAAGKRPRSAMAPTVVMHKGRLFMLAGSPGGSAIINFVSKTLIGVLDWQLDVQQSINLPNIGSRNRETELERGSAAESLQQGLRQRGHRVTILPMPSGVHAIVLDQDGITGGADPRREGRAAGE
ncbi:Ggt Gamma-glutamyltransferase [Oxalobacteraceae bacterium]